MLRLSLCRSVALPRLAGCHANKLAVADKDVMAAAVADAAAASVAIKTFTLVGVTFLSLSSAYLPLSICRCFLRLLTNKARNLKRNSIRSCLGRVA